MEMSGTGTDITLNHVGTCCLCKSPWGKNQSGHECMFLYEYDIALFIVWQWEPGVSKELNMAQNFRPLCRDTETLEVIAKPLSSISERLYELGRVCSDCGMTTFAPTFKEGKKYKPGSYRSVSLTPFPGKIMDYVLWKAVPGHMKEREELGTVGVDLLWVNHVWPTCLPSVMKGLDLWRRGKQWMSFMLIIVRPSVLSPVVSSYPVRHCSLDQWTTSWMKNWGSD